MFLTEVLDSVSHWVGLENTNPLKYKIGKDLIIKIKTNFITPSNSF